jgi:hypothetical protein
MIRLWLATIFMAVLTGSAQAQIPPAGRPVVAPPVTPAPSIAGAPGITTSRGAGLVTGTPGSPQTVTIPGSAVPGTLINNGNGTSTIMVPGSPSELVPTPR